jgi:hypothetical protein
MSIVCAPARLRRGSTVRDEQGPVDCRGLIEVEPAFSEAAHPAVFENRRRGQLLELRLATFITSDLFKR